jgi:hypothetical protein
MKTIRLLSVFVFATAMLADPAWAAEQKKPCCEATVEAGKKCDHPCCKKAAEANKVCKKCHPPAKKAEEKK